MIGSVEQKQPRTMMRFLIIVLALFIAWYLMTKVLALFDYSIGRKTSTLLAVTSGTENVQVSLQGADWQRTETNLKLYPGDAIAVRGNANVILTFFDGSRIRLDKGSELVIDESENVDRSDSSIGITLRFGKLWVSTPSLVAFSGSILRSIATPHFTAELRASTQALVSINDVVVLRSQGEGLNLAMNEGGKANIVIGEGQYAHFTDDAIRAIGSGQDPYDFRDPIPQQMLKDEFLATSYALLSQETTTVTGTGSDITDLSGTDLVITSPENHATVTTKTVTVSGRTSNRVALVLVNGQNVAIRKDLIFSVDMSLGKEPSSNIRIEAQDLQGITLSSIDRTIQNAYKPDVAAVRFKSPIASGGTLTTSQREVEITGEAPSGAAAIIMNDYKLQLFKPGSKTWSYLASTALGNMVEGKNVYTVTVLDAEGNKSEPRSITIIFNQTASGSGTVSAPEPPIKQNAPLSPGTLSVQTPAAGLEATTDQAEVILAGQTSADTNSISINGYTLSLYLPGKTTWNYIASTALQTMKRGRNVYRIVSRNANGEILDVLEYTINFKPN